MAGGDQRKNADRLQQVDALTRTPFCSPSQEPSPLVSQQPRLESRDVSSSAGNLPSSAYHPLMLASSELGVYVKWALLLQEQLEHVQADRTALTQQCTKFQTENQRLRKALLEENPQRYAHLVNSGERTAQSAAQSLRASPAASMPLSTSSPSWGGGLAAPMPKTSSPLVSASSVSASSAIASTVTQTAAAVIKTASPATTTPAVVEMSMAPPSDASNSVVKGRFQQGHMNQQVQEPPSAESVTSDVGSTEEAAKREDLLSTPNLRMLATFLGDERSGEQDGRERAVTSRSSAMTSRSRTRAMSTDGAQSANKFVRNNSSGRSLPAFNKLSGDSAANR